MAATEAQSTALAVLRRNFVKHLQERSAVIQEIRHLCEVGQASAEHYKNLKREAHKLAGSGGSYGFSEIRERAQSLEGSLDATSTNTSVYLPLIDALLEACATAEAVTGAEQPVEQAPAPAVPEPQRAATGTTILVVDDDESIRSLVGSLFSEQVRVVEAPDADRAQVLLVELRPDVIILDEDMPGLKGRDLLARIKSNTTLAEVPVIMLTSNQRAADIAVFIAEGITTYCPKPFAPQTLKERIESILIRRRTTVMIIDDDIAVGELLRHKFQALGFRVVLASNGQQAVTMAKNCKADLYVLDRMMPGLDGFAVLKALRAQPGGADIPVLMLTAKRRPEDIVQGLELGANDYVVKPFAPDEVLARSMRLLRLPAFTP